VHRRGGVDCVWLENAKLVNNYAILARCSYQLPSIKGQGFPVREQVLAPEHFRPFVQVHLKSQALHWSSRTQLQ